jgi:hypothetical protein
MPHAHRAFGQPEHQFNTARGLLKYDLALQRAQHTGLPMKEGFQDGRTNMPARNDNGAQAEHGNWIEKGLSMFF